MMLIRCATSAESMPVWPLLPAAASAVAKYFCCTCILYLGLRGYLHTVCPRRLASSKVIGRKQGLAREPKSCKRGSDREDPRRKTGCTFRLAPGSTAGAAFPFEIQRIPAGSCLGLFDVSHGNERMGMERYDSAALEGVWMVRRVCPPVTFRRCARFYPECAGRPRGALRMFREEKKLGAWSGSSPVRSCPSCDAGPSLCDPLAASSPSHPQHRCCHPRHACTLLLITLSSLASTPASHFRRASPSPPAPHAARFELQ
ncbi:hypothetical protein BDY17DRAFT_14766 [Neohortaea acidophila]|uniref:Uncharacterized protein n=1 Tax=Neohortaea acidophila TaxID=245834 RepID=A0A6A6Q596_9PEZI|nr:uncharacterized protein BDY17DRAFT_14766 [Neohortaea acidophila]KAF2487618.1 hypothetical protein BDY17DRAFT_14766 [Neohortaea acidophila]